MDFILLEIRKCLIYQLWHSAISLAVTLPAICGAAEEKTSRNKRRRDRATYIAWVESSSLYRKYGKDFPEGLYALRCSILHEGSYYTANSNIPRLLVVCANNLSVHNCTFQIDYPDHQEKAVALDCSILCTDIIDAVNNWQINNSSNKTVMDNLSRMVNYYKNGLPPYVVGAPVIG